MYLFLFKSKVVNLGILAQKSDFCLKLEEGLVNNKCKLNNKIFYQVSSAYFTLCEEKLNEILTDCQYLKEDSKNLKGLKFCF